MAATLGCDSSTVWISDSGRGMLPRLDSPGLGFGPPLMGRLCDDLQFSSDDGAAGTCVTATFVYTRRPATAHRRDEPVAGSGRREMLRDYLQAFVSGARRFSRRPRPCSPKPASRLPARAGNAASARSIAD